MRLGKWASPQSSEGIEADGEDAKTVEDSPRHRRQVEEAHREALLRGWEVERVQAVAGICIGGKERARQ